MDSKVEAQTRSQCEYMLKFMGARPSDLEISADYLFMVANTD